MYLFTQHNPDVCLRFGGKVSPVKGRDEVQISFCLLVENLAIWKRPECREKFTGYTFCKFNCISINTTATLGEEHEIQQKKKQCKTLGFV